MIKNLNIANFRCFQNFQLDHTGRITLISGRNNVGKTALLEAMFLLFASMNPEGFVTTNFIRGNLLTIFKPDVTWEHLFYKRNMDYPVKISLDLSGKNIALELSRNAVINHVPALPPGSQFLPLPNTYPLNIKYSLGGQKYNGTCFPLQNGLSTSWDRQPEPNRLPGIKYLGIAPDNEQNLAIIFGQALKSGQKDFLLEALRKLEPELIDISTVAEDTPRLYAQKKNGPMLPLSSMGNGICRLTQILCAICVQNKSIVLVDEIDSGFHYSFFPELWRIISEISKLNEVLLIATTHSYDCLKGASVCFNNPNEDFAYIRLGKNSAGRILPHIYPPDLMAYAIDEEMELR